MTSLLDCPVEVITEILRYLDKKDLPKVVLVCKTLDDLASHILYENFPVFDPEKLLEINYIPHDVGGYLFPMLSPRNAAFVKHLVLETASFRLWNASIRNAIVHCLSLQFLTLYLLNSWEDGFLNMFRDMPIFSVTELSLHIKCSPDEGWLDNLLPMFRNLVTLRVAVLDDQYPSVLLFRQISQAANIQNLEVNLFPKDGKEYGLSAELFPTVKSVTLTETHFRTDSSYVVFHNPTPSPYRGHTITPSALSTIVSIEQSYDWKIKILGTHLILRHFEELPPNLELSHLCKNATSPFHEWAENHKIKIIPECRNIDLPFFESQDTEVFLNLRCAEYPPIHHDLHIQFFLSNIVPTTRSLIINTHIGSPVDQSTYDLPGFQSQPLQNFFSEVVRQEPNFQLQHFQNFPTLDGDTTVYFPAMDARAIAPLATLHSLTSIDLDFYYLSISPP